MKKNQKAKRRYTRLIDLLLNVVLLLLCSFTIYKAYTLDMLPTQWLIILVAALIVVILIFVVLMFMRIPNWTLIVKRTILIALCVVIGYVGYSIGHVSRAVEKVSTEDTSDTIKINVITLKDSTIKSIPDLDNAMIGYQSATDKDNALYAQTKINEKVTQTPVYDEQLDYTTLSTFFLQGSYDALIISDTYLSMLNANIEGFKDSYSILTTYERERPANPSNEKDITKESFTLLISGVDEMGAADMQHLSDVNILLFVNPVANQITMISLPRDSVMPNAGLGYVNDKLTHTGNYGIDATVDTVENFLDIDVDYYAKVSFSSLIEIVDAIDGIEVDVEIDFTEQDENRSFEDSDLITLNKGVQTINGKQALAYSRHRKTENYDTAGRERAQERIIKAIIDKLISPEGVTVYVNKLMDIVPNYVVTNMPGKQITSFIKGELKELNPWNITSLTVENGIFDTRLVPNIATPVDVYLFNQYDVQMIKDAYNSSKENMQFENFNFDLSDMGKYLPNMNNDPNLVWDTMALDPH